jgi:hypothetical protein
LGALLRQATKSMLGTGRIRNRTFFLGGKDHFDPWPSNPVKLHCYMLLDVVVKKRPKSYGKGSPCLTYDFYIYFYIFFWKELKEPTKLPSGNQQWLAG